jgi:effector-binding domain-containing protein
LPGGEAAHARHNGPFDQVGAAFAAIDAWCAANNRQAGGAGWEIYLSNPQAEPDASKWITEVYVPLRPKGDGA